jgi:hypothetical protein
MKKGPRKASEPELVGAADAAAILGVHQQNLRRQVGLPEPYDTVRATTLWRADEIRAFAAMRAKRDPKRRALSHDEPVAA